MISKENAMSVEQLIAEFVGGVVPEAETTTTAARGELKRLIHEKLPVCSSERSQIALVAPGDVLLHGPSGRILPNGLRRIHAVTPSCEVRLTLCGIESPTQAVFFPEVPLPIDGTLMLGKHPCKSVESLVTFYRAQLEKHARDVKKRMARAERASEADRLGIYPHDLWSAP